MKKYLLIAILGACSLSAIEAPRKSLSLLEQSSQAFTEIADKAMPATVFIKAELTQVQQQFANPFEMFGDDFFQRFFGQQFNAPQMQQQQPQIAGGSGFLVASDGYIVTNNHVIKDAGKITVTLNDGREYVASVKGADPRSDLAVIKIEEKDLPFLTFGDSEGLKIGEWVVAIGNPFGIGATLTVGVVSAKGRQDLGIASYEDFIQTDAAINVGNSGGPLLNLQGELIGVNTAIFTKGGAYVGIGLAIPSRMAESVVDQIVDSGSVKRAYLGVILQPLDKELADAFSLEKQEGVIVSDVVKGSPASKVGLQAGDIIVQCNGKPVKNVTKFRNEIGMMSPGSDIKLSIVRNSKLMQLMGELGSQEGEVVSAEVLAKLGLEIENVTPDLANRLGLSTDAEGVVISKVKPGSAAAQAGLRAGFLISGVALNLSNQKPVRNTAEMEEALQETGDKKHLILIVRHQNYKRYYTLKVN
jgi:serine protease Do